MSTESSASQNPTRAVSTFLRVSLSEIVSVVVLSLLYTLAALSILPIGAGLLSLIDTFYNSVTFTGTGGGVPPRTSDRATHFVSSIWEYLRAGIPYTLFLILAVVGLFVYFEMAVFGGSTSSLAIGIAGIYATVLVLVLLFRAANIVVHASEDDRPGFVSAISQSWSSIMGNLAYSSMHIVVAATIVLLCRVFPVAIVVFLPGLLAMLEILMYEELDGIGAKTILYAYRDPQE